MKIDKNILIDILKDRNIKDTIIGLDKNRSISVNCINKQSVIEIINPNATDINIIFRFKILSSIGTFNNIAWCAECSQEDYLKYNRIRKINKILKG